MLKRAKIKALKGKVLFCYKSNYILSHFTFRHSMQGLYGKIRLEIKHLNLPLLRIQTNMSATKWIACQ